MGVIIIDNNNKCPNCGRDLRPPMRAATGYTCYWCGYQIPIYHA